MYLQGCSLFTGSVVSRHHQEVHEKRKPHTELFHNESLHCTRPTGLYSNHRGRAMVSIAIYWQIFSQSNEVSLNLGQSSDSVPVSLRGRDTEKYKFAFYSSASVQK